MKITLTDLRRHRACADQAAIFAAEWPDGCEVTQATCLRAVELGLDVHWTAQRWLPLPLLDEFERRENARWQEYLRQCALLFSKIVAEAGL